jgi:hypothetical protein
MNLATLVGWAAGLWQRVAWYAAVGAILVGFGAGTCWYFVADRIATLKAEKDTLSRDLTRAIEARQLDQQVGQERAEVRQKRATEARSASAKDAEALGKAQAWADAQVPQEVRNALR